MATLFRVSQNTLTVLNAGTPMFRVSQNVLTVLNPFEDNNYDVLSSDNLASWADVLADYVIGAYKQTLTDDYNNLSDAMLSSLEVVQTVEASDDMDEMADVLAAVDNHIGKEAADDLNNWLENLLTGGQQEFGVTDTLALTDAVSLLGNGLLQPSDTLALTDKLALLYATFLTLEDALELSDELAVLNTGLSTINASDDLNSYDESVELFSSYQLEFQEFLVSFKDKLEVNKAELLAIASDLSSWNDVLSSTAFNELLATVSSDIDNWLDTVSSDYLDRFVQQKRTELITYLRRYLNDPEVSGVRNIQVGISDSANNWGDGI